MKTPTHAVILGTLTGIAIIGLIVLAALGRPLPEVLPALGIAGVSALAGLAVPGVTATTQAAVLAAPTVTVPAPVAAVVRAPEFAAATQTPVAGAVVPGLSPVQADLLRTG